MKTKIMFVIICLVMFCSCAISNGPKFNGVIHPPLKDKATLYIYRPWGFFGCAGDLPIVINNINVYPEISNNSYGIYYVNPGDIKIHSDISMVIDRILKFKTKPNKTYFISLKLCGFWVSSTNFHIVSKQRALKEMQGLIFQGVGVSYHD